MSSYGLIRVQAIDAELTGGGILSREEVEQIVAPQELVSVARQRAAQVLWHARRRRSLVHYECETLLQQAEQQAMQTVADIVAEARNGVIEKAVTWLVDEATLERKVAARVEQRLRDIAAEAIEAWSGSASMGEVVARTVVEAVATQRLTTCSVRVHPEAVEEVAAALRSFEECAVVGDKAIAQGAAEIDSEFVHVSVDLATELQAIVNAIRSVRETE